MARARKLFNDSRHRFCNSPSIFCSFVLWKNTSYPYNRAPSYRRNRDTPPRPYTPLQALQTASRTLCICTVKKAFFSPQKDITFLLYSQTVDFASDFSALKALYKIAFPSKKLSKNPLTSKPVFSKQPIKSYGVAILNLQF